jgi:hypothetical protein
MGRSWSRRNALAPTASGEFAMQVATAPGSLQPVEFAPRSWPRLNHPHRRGPRPTPTGSHGGHPRVRHRLHAQDETSVLPGCTWWPHCSRPGSSAPCSKALPTATAVLLAEHTFRFNRHTSRSRGQLFDRLLKPALHTEPTPWPHSSAHPAIRPLQLSADPEHLRQSLAQPGLVRITEVIGARLPQG